MKRGLVGGVVLVLILGAVQAASTDNAVTVTATQLSSSPNTDASNVAAVPNGTGVNIVGRQGGWYHVKLDSGQDGWLPMTSIKYAGANTASASSGSAGSSVLSIFSSGRDAAGGTAATTGVRGLNTGDIANAKPDPAAVALLDKWQQNPTTAKQYAAALPVTATSVAYIPKGK